jgi:hypothetical protein
LRQVSRVQERILDIASGILCNRSAADAFDERECHVDPSRDARRCQDSIIDHPQIANHRDARVKLGEAIQRSPVGGCSSPAEQPGLREQQ